MMARLALPLMGLLSLCLAVGMVAALWWGWLRDREADAMAAEITALRAAAAGCSARNDNLTEDRRSDDAIDRLPDDGLRHVPDHWLR